jgi:hypothetical protein
LTGIENILNNYNAVSLEEANKDTRLMTRIDRKYWFSASDLQTVLEQLMPICDVLEVNGKRIINYQTTYFDTEDAEMYLHHHNRRLHRFKVRKRKYETSANGFFEIKRKNNKKVTRKIRMETDFGEKQLVQEEIEFLTTNSPYHSSMLKPVLHNNFYRITLISKCRKDRCTIDLQPQFSNETNEYRLNNLVIFELKRGSKLNDSPVVAVLKKLGIRHRGLSKYCTGRAMLTPGLKKNAFKPRLRYLMNKLNNKKPI